LVKFKRVLFKLSGEMLVGSGSFGIDQKACLRLAEALKEVQDAGVSVGVVIGGGNFFRGINLEEMGLSRVPSDQMGMLATLINGVALLEALRCVGSQATLMSALECPKVAKTYDWRAAKDALDRGDIAIFVGGTGNPYFTTDTAAALRASEIGADVLMKATKVDGVYDCDPFEFPSAKRFETLTFSEALERQLGIMDATALALCRKENVSILVFHMKNLKKGKILTALTQDTLGTWIRGE